MPKRRHTVHRSLAIYRESASEKADSPAFWTQPPISSLMSIRKGWRKMWNKLLLPITALCHLLWGKNTNFPLIFLRTCAAECAPLAVELNHCQGGVSQLISFSDKMNNSGTSCKNKIAANKICVCVSLLHAAKRGPFALISSYSAYWHSIKVSNLTLHLILTNTSARHRQLKKEFFKNAKKGKTGFYSSCNGVSPLCCTHFGSLWRLNAKKKSRLWLEKVHSPTHPHPSLRSHTHTTSQQTLQGP